LQKNFEFKIFIPCAVLTSVQPFKNSFRFKLSKILFPVNTSILVENCYKIFEKAQNVFNVLETPVLFTGESSDTVILFLNSRIKAYFFFV